MNIGNRFFLIPVIGLACLLNSVDGRTQGNPKSTESDKSFFTRSLNRIARAWETADGAVFRELLVPDRNLYLIESGGANIGVDDLVDHHVIPEKGHFEEMAVKIDLIEAHVSHDGKTAWTVAKTTFKATAKNQREIDNSGYQTVLWEKRQGEWKIVHSHSSSRKARKRKGH